MCAESFYHVFEISILSNSTDFFLRKVCFNSSRETTKYWKVKKINSTEQRIGGFCPLTPKEVGIFLQALGFPPSTPIYIAAGEIYGGNTHLSELSSRFPNLISKVRKLVCCRTVLTSTKIAHNLWVRCSVHLIK